MSVDFNECEYCYESRIDDVCYTRIIDGIEVCACSYCISDEIEKGNLVEIDEESDEYKSLSKKDKVDIDNYGCIYKRTDKGVAKRLKEIEKEIKALQKEKENLMKGK